MRIATATLFCLLTASAALASLTSSALTGRVTAGDAAAADVTITLTSTALQHERTTTTSSKGMYWIGGLPPGTYDVTFSAKGMQTLTRRAVVELGRTARADAKLERSEEEESVTSTATTVGVADTTSITTHFSDAELDRLPYSRWLTGFRLAPGPFFDQLLLDDGELREAIGGEELIEEETAIRGALPVEDEGFVRGVISERTRSGGEAFSLSVRDTWTDASYGNGNIFESASGGRIVPQRLWFFAGGWAGDAPAASDWNGVLLKLTGQLGAAHNLVGEYRNARSKSTILFDGSREDFRTHNETVRYTGVLSDRLLVEGAGSRFTYGDGFFTSHHDTATAKVSYRLGEHVIAGGVDRWLGTTSLFLGDRLAWRGLTVDAGLRGRDGDLSPRVAATYDFRGDGRQAFSASWGDYSGAGLPPAAHVATIGYATAIGASGSTRIDYIRRDLGTTTLDQLQLDARYRLFDRFEAGASYTYSRNVGTDLRNIGSAWIGATLPVGSHEVGATILEHHLYGDQWTTDLALRYAIPFSRLGLTLAADATDLFDVYTLEGRTVRLWARLRV